MPLEPSERLRRLMVEVCPLKVGDRVTVAPSFRYASEWTGEYIVTGLRWEYQSGAGHSINVEIASEDDILTRAGCTDGFDQADLVFVKRGSPPAG